MIPQNLMESLLPGGCVGLWACRHAYILFRAAKGCADPQLIIPNSPPPANLGTLNCFFIAYLGSMDHEMDFESNLFFPSQKWSDT